MLWPPGHRCTYVNPAETFVFESGDAVSFFAIAAAGLILLLWRRSTLAWATMFACATAGAAMWRFSLDGVTMGLTVGFLLALLATRSLLAATAGAGVLILAVLPWFQFDSGIGSAIVLLLVALVPQRAEVMREPAPSR